jgi:5-methylcytosine-specific restriction endonuclease McrA
MGLISTKTAIRRRLIYLEYNCFECSSETGIESFHLHHIDRNPENNKHSNLSWLCPVCHYKVHKERNFSTYSIADVVPLEELEKGFRY